MMDTKSMKYCKNKLYEMLSSMYDDIAKEVKFDWCTSHSRSEELNKIYENIKSYRNEDFIPQRITQLSCDYVSHNGHIVIEYDEIQHFTIQRQLALEAYPKELQLLYDKDMWIKLCKEYHRSMNKRKDPMRDEKRAFYDSIRDILIPKNGYSLIRIYHGQIDFDGKNAVSDLKRILNRKYGIKNR